MCMNKLPEHFWKRSRKVNLVHFILFTFFKRRSPPRPNKQHLNLGLVLGGTITFKNYRLVSWGQDARRCRKDTMCRCLDAVGEQAKKHLGVVLRKSPLPHSADHRKHFAAKSSVRRRVYKMNAASPGTSRRWRLSLHAFHLLTHLGLRSILKNVPSKS